MVQKCGPQGGCDSFPLPRAPRLQSKQTCTENPFKLRHRNFPEFDDAIAEGSSEAADCSLSQIETAIESDFAANLSIGGQAAWNEHQRFVAKFGFDSLPPSSSPGKRDLPVVISPEGSPDSNPMDAEWDRLLDGSISQVSVASSMLRGADKSLSCISDGVHANNSSGNREGSDFFESSQIWSLQTPERIRSRQAPLRLGVTCRGQTSPSASDGETKMSPPNCSPIASTFLKTPPLPHGNHQPATKELSLASFQVNDISRISDVMSPPSEICPSPTQAGRSPPSEINSSFCPSPTRALFPEDEVTPFFNSQAPPSPIQQRQKQQQQKQQQQQQKQEQHKKQQAPHSPAPSDEVREPPSCASKSGEIGRSMRISSSGHKPKYLCRYNSSRAMFSAPHLKPSLSKPARSKEFMPLAANQTQMPAPKAEQEKRKSKASSCTGKSRFTRRAGTVADRFAVMKKKLVQEAAEKRLTKQSNNRVKSDLGGNSTDASTSPENSPSGQSGTLPSTSPKQKYLRHLEQVSQANNHIYSQHSAAATAAATTTLPGRSSDLVRAKLYENRRRYRTVVPIRAFVDCGEAPHYTPDSFAKPLEMRQGQIYAQLYDYAAQKQWK